MHFFFLEKLVDEERDEKRSGKKVRFESLSPIHIIWKILWKYFLFSPNFNLQVFEQKQFFLFFVVLEKKYKDEISFLVDVEENKNHILYGKYLDEEEGIHR